MSKVDSLAFTIKYPDNITSDEVPSWSNLRLFSAGGGSELAEWDIEKGTIRVCLSLKASLPLKQNVNHTTFPISVLSLHRVVLSGQ